MYLIVDLLNYYYRNVDLYTRGIYEFPNIVHFLEVMHQIYEKHIIFYEKILFVLKNRDGFKMIVEDLEIFEIFVSKHPKCEIHIAYDDKKIDNKAHYMHGRDDKLVLELAKKYPSSDIMSNDKYSDRKHFNKIGKFRTIIIKN